MVHHRKMGLRDLAAAVRERRASARELVAESLRRIDALDPDLGAVVALRADEALHDARGLDAAIAGGAEAGALAGLPLLVKDMTDVAGMRTTFGSRLFSSSNRRSAFSNRSPHSLIALKSAQLFNTDRV